MADVNSTATQNQTQQQTQTEPQKQPNNQVSGTQQQTQTTKPEDNSNGNELTVESLMAQLAQEKANNAKLKSDNDKLCTSEGNLRKQLRAKQTAEEQEAEAKAEQAAQRDAYVKELEKFKSVTESSERYLGMGMPTEMAKATATAEYEGNMDVVTLTAPAKSSYNQSGHYYGVQIIAKDEAGNTTTVNQSDATLGSKLRLTVKEKTAPVITISSPTASQLLTSNQPTISFTVTDDDSGVNPDTIKLLIDGSEISGITKTKTTSGYSCSYKPSTALSDGSHTVVVKASDYDGNAATQKSVSFKIDTVPPELSVTSPVNKLVTNKTTVTVAGTTNDATSSPVTLTINGSAVTVYDDGTFSKDITLKDGSNTITVVAKDGAGRTTTVTRTVTLDTKAPVISDVSLAPNPADVGATYVISVSVTD